MEASTSPTEDDSLGGMCQFGKAEPSPFSSDRAMSDAGGVSNSLHPCVSLDWLQKQ